MKAAKVDKERSAFLRKRSREHKDSVEEARLQNVSEGREGQVRVDKLPHFRSKQKDKSWPNKEGFHNINVCSSATSFLKQLSPMTLGPYVYEVGRTYCHAVQFLFFSKILIFEQYQGEKIKVKNMENLWQFSKVWSGEVDSSGNPTKQFFERRRKGWADSKGRRRAKPADVLSKAPLFSYWKGVTLFLFLCNCKESF